MRFINKEHILFHIGKLLARISVLGSVKVLNPPVAVQGAAIYVANHPSTLDPYFVIGSLPQPTRILISEYVFQIPFFNFLLRQAGHVEVQNGNGGKAYQHALAALKQGHSLLIFPEGVLSSNVLSVDRLHTGAVRLAMETNIPVIPIGIYLNPENIRRLAVQFGKNREMGNWYSSGFYGITFGKAIYFTGDVKNREEVLRQCEVLRERMNEQILYSSAHIKRRKLERIPTFNPLYLFVYFFRMHFAYTSWVNSH